MAVKSLNLSDLYSLDSTLVSVLFSKILYISFADKENKGFCPPSGIWNMIFKTLLSAALSLSAESPNLSHSAGKDLVPF